MKDSQSIKECQKLWRENKYLVLSKSQRIYLEIREYLKSDRLDMKHLQELIQKAIDMDTSPGDLINAYQHIWGYFKRDATEEEKQKFLELVERFKKEEITEQHLKDYINQLLIKYPNKYLEESSILR